MTAMPPTASVASVVRRMPGFCERDCTRADAIPRSRSGHFRGRPHRHLPERVSARVAHAGDHLAPAALDLLARHAAGLGDRVGVAVPPGFPDAREDLALDAQRVYDDVVDG